MIELSRGSRVPVFLAALLLSASLCGATTVVQVEDFPGLVEQSRRAALVEVVEVSYGYDESRLPSTTLVLRVEDRIYGASIPEVGETFRIKMLGAPVEMPDGRRFYIDGTPRYRAGERYVLMLLGESELGFTNTASLGFGAFRVTADAAGRPVARSAAGNRRTFGESGVRTWLQDETLATAEIADPAAPVPYPLLRRVLTDQWDAVGAGIGVEP